jgi:5-methylthioadenosine/S-adenosylhomocysteine deaminase
MSPNTLSSAVLMKQENSAPLLLSGRIVHPDGSARQRYVLVRDGRIVWVGVGRPPDVLTEGAREIVTGPRGWVFPGLINLHTHTAYNILPVWHSRKAPFSNRFEWRADADYRADISGRLDGLRKVKGSRQTLAVISELQAIAGGTTVLDQSTRLDANDSVESKIVLCRDTGTATDVGLPADQRIDSIVDFFSPDKGIPSPKKDNKGQSLISAYAQARDAGRLGATLVHLAEGRSGFGSGRGVDAYSRAEFEAFMRDPALLDSERVRSAPLSLVHGSGVDVNNDAHLRFLRDRNISIVWSPVSNLLLYGDTLDSERLLQSGINVALGSDWSPSGSKHVWDEAKFARHFHDAIGSTVSDADIFRMVTSSAARCLGSQQLGRIDEGAFADMFILESPIDSDSALEVFFAADDRHVLATIVNGVPIYGRGSFLQQFGLPLQSLPVREGTAARDKAVYLPTISIDLGTAVDEIEDHLKQLERPALRSNILASSDKPYQRRIQRLRGQVEYFGWSVKQTTRGLAKGGTPMNGLVPVKPDAVRVWCGFMAGSNQRRFLDQIGSVFLPSTVMLMRALGLTAYFPGIPPADHPPACPDEVAIGFYESQKAYTETKNSVGGRLYDVMHDTVFRNGEYGSWSAFPTALSSPLSSRSAYHLFDGAIDWYAGLTRLLMSVRDPSRQDTQAFQKDVHRVCASLAQDPRGVDGALLAVDDDYAVFWDHRSEARPADDWHLALFGEFSQVILKTHATDQNANGEFFEPWGGFSLQGGECLRLTFERRSLFPW